AETLLLSRSNSLLLIQNLELLLSKKKKKKKNFFSFGFKPFFSFLLSFFPAILIKSKFLFFDFNTFIFFSLFCPSFFFFFSLDFFLLFFRLIVMVLGSLPVLGWGLYLWCLFRWKHLAFPHSLFFQKQVARLYRQSRLSLDPLLKKGIKRADVCQHYQDHFSEL